MSRFRTSVAVTAVALVGASLPLLSGSQATAAGPGYLQWDFDKDGHADLAVGAPGEDVGSKVDAGKVSVFMASGSGTYHDATDWTQAMLGGAAENGDQFGYAMTSGDYDADGYADLAVAANREGYNSGGTNVGIVTVIWGSPTGLTADGAVNLAFNVNGKVSSNSFAGDALASGDMDGDGADELAVGAPGIEIVKLYKGQFHDKAALGSSATYLSEYNLPGDKHLAPRPDLFGETLAMGDFDGDTLADLVIGAPYDWDDRGYSVGAIVVVPGSAGGPDVAGSKRWSPDSPGISSAPHTFTVNDQPDSFGRTLGVGDYDGDGNDDVAVGIPGSTVGGIQDAGAVNILFGSASGISDRDTLITQETSGIASKSATGDLFGASLDGGGAPGARDLLAVGSAEEVVWALPGGEGTGSLAFTQDSPGVYGGREVGDAFGAFVRFVDTAGSGNDFLAVGSPGESYSTGEASAGVVYVLRSDGPLPTGTDSMKFEEADPDVDGGRESGDAFGWLGDSH